jgi:hypothetical protein
VRAAGTHLMGSGASSGDGRRVPLIEQWDGVAWQIVTTPEPSGATSTPLSITTDGAGNYWAVGSSLSGNMATMTQTLILHCPWRSVFVAASTVGRAAPTQALRRRAVPDAREPVATRLLWPRIRMCIVGR